MSTLEVPRTPDQLHRYIRAALGITLSREARLAGHASHFDYIAHSFFSDALADAASASPHNDPLDAVVLAPRGGGKTFLGALATTLDMIFKPGIQIRIVAGSEDQGSRMLQYLHQFFLRPAINTMVRGKPGKTAVELNNNSRVEVLAQSHASVRGIRVHKIKCDEVELFDPDIFAAVQLTTKSGRCGEFDVRGTVDCLSTQHLVGGLMQRMVSEAARGCRRLFRWSLVDSLATCDDRRACEGRDGAGPCPLQPECEGRAKVVTPLINGHLQIDDAIRMKRRVDQDTWRAEMLCLTPGRSLAVFRDFHPSRHIVAEEPPRQRQGWRTSMVCGMDFGFRSPTVILWGVYEDGGGSNDRLTIIGEYQETQRTIDDHIAEMRKRGHTLGMPEWIGADPAGNANTGASPLGSHIAQLRRAGLIVRTTRCDIQTGLTILRRRLAPAIGDARLFIHRRCVQLIEAIQNYHYPANQQNVEIPEKDGWDHMCDALRYLVVNLERGEMRTRKYA